MASLDEEIANHQLDNNKFMIPEGRKKYCCKYPGCNNWYCTKLPEGSVNKHFYRFPKDPYYHERWKSICNIDPSTNCQYWTICEDHFEESAFVNIKRERLNINVVPRPLNNNEASSVLKTLIPNQHGNIEIILKDSADNNEITNILDLNKSILRAVSEDHNYIQKVNDQEPVSISDFDFLLDKSDIDYGINNESVCTQLFMQNTHKNIQSKLAQLKSILEKDKDRLGTLKKLYNYGKLDYINKNANYLSKKYIKSQFKNSIFKRSVHEWGKEEQTCAFSLYQKGPNLYIYLQFNFDLPSTKVFKAVLSKFEFGIGTDSKVFEYLKNEVDNMKSANRYCALMFSKMPLTSEFYYEKNKQFINGFGDMGPLGRINEVANSALVFMVRGIRKQWKQAVGYYLIPNTVSIHNVAFLIKHVIYQLQIIGLTVVATIFDQSTTNYTLLYQLCGYNLYHFFVNEYPIVVIFDVPYLLKSTRDALLKCKIQFSSNKCAKFEYIKLVFEFDQQKVFKSLPKLKSQNFDFTDPYQQTKVKVAATQLSYSVASCIETFVTISNKLPAEALYTAEFIYLIDTLFDSLNSSDLYILEHKPLKQVLLQNSTHLQFWSDLLLKMNQWKLFDLTTEADVTDQFLFVKGWQITIKSIIFLWNNFKTTDGFKYLALRALNKDPLENFFTTIQQYSDGNLTCRKFDLAFKYAIINKLVVSTNSESNCEDDMCTVLVDLTYLLENAFSESETIIELNKLVFRNIPFDEEEALAYIAGYLLKNLKNPYCKICWNVSRFKYFTSQFVTRICEDLNYSTLSSYSSSYLMESLRAIYEMLYKFLKTNGYQINLIDNFKDLFKLTEYCFKHECWDLIVEKCVTLFIFKYCRDNLMKMQLTEKLEKG